MILVCKYILAIKGEEESKTYFFHRPCLLIISFEYHILYFDFDKIAKCSVVFGKNVQGENNNRYIG